MTDPKIELLEGDCLEVMPTLAESSIDSIITDPPYGLSFMGKEWDHGIPGVPFWTAALRVAKPGAMLMAFGGTRTWHRLAVAIEDAGWEIRDTICWLYGSGFPKSLDVGKAIDLRKDWAGLQRLQGKVRAARVDRGLTQTGAARLMGMIGPDESLGGGGYMWFETGRRIPTREEYHRLKAALDLDDECDLAFESAEREVVDSHGTGSSPGGFGEHRFTFNSQDITAPATEAAKKWDGWGTALKPAFEPIIVAMKPLSGTYAENAIEHGVAGFHIDGGRVGSEEMAVQESDGTFHSVNGSMAGHNTGRRVTGSVKGRWPANVIHDASPEVLAGFPMTASGSRAPGEHNVAGGGEVFGEYPTGPMPAITGDSGSAARYFYTAKADKVERQGVKHPTVKPIALMEYLCKLTKTPTGGVVLDPFMGSGTTGVACINTGRDFIGIEKDPENYAEADARIDSVANVKIFEEE